jgi:hypothetical protein
MSVKCGYLITRPAGDTSATAFLFGATGQEWTRWGTGESAYLRDAQAATANRPPIRIGLGSCYLMIGRKGELSDLFTRKRDQVLEKAGFERSPGISKEDYGLKSIVVHYGEVPPTFSQQFAQMAASVATALVPIPLVMDGVAESTSHFQDLAMTKMMLKFYLDYVYKDQAPRKDNAGKVYALRDRITLGDVGWNLGLVRGTTLRRLEDAG